MMSARGSALFNVVCVYLLLLCRELILIDDICSYLSTNRLPAEIATKTNISTRNNQHGWTIIARVNIGGDNSVIR